MSFIDIEYDTLTISCSPILSLNYFPKKFYRLYQSIKSDDNIIINGSFLFNETNEIHICNSPMSKKPMEKLLSEFSLEKDIPYYKNIEKLFINYKNLYFYINIDKLSIENSSTTLDNIVYQSNIKTNKNIQYRDFVILSLNPVLINISYDKNLCTNFVRISCINDMGCGGSSYSYLYEKNFRQEVPSISCIQSL
jgi:hypothetical protein